MKQTTAETMRNVVLMECVLNTAGSYCCVCKQGFVARGTECEGKSQISESAEC